MSRRANLVLVVVFAVFLGVVVALSVSAGRVECEVCVVEADHRACAAGRGADEAAASSAATALACGRLHERREAVGGPRVRPVIDEASPCLRATPASRTCRSVGLGR